MAAFQSRTREQIRRAIAANLDQVPASSATDAGTTTTLIDANYLGGDDEYNGGWIVFTSGANDGLIRRVTDYSSSTGTFTFKPASTAATASSDTYEYWRADYPPERIHEFINQAIIQRTPRGLVTDEDESNFGHPLDSRHPIPSAMVALAAVDYRNSISGVRIDQANTAWTAGTNVTTSTDSEDYKAFSSSSRFYLSGVSAGTIGYKDITSVNLAKYNQVEFWIKSSVTRSSGELTFVTSSTTGLANATETINIPALTARTWTYVKLSLANPELDTAILSVGIKYADASGASPTGYLWLNDINVVDSGSGTYTRIWPGSYRVERETREVILSQDARREIGYKLIRLIGYRLPSLLSSDSSVAEIDSDLITARATAKSLFSLARGRSTDPDDNDRRAAYFETIAAQAERSLPNLRPGTKMVD